jgi:hypothetical protein
MRESRSKDKPRSPTRKSTTTSPTPRRRKSSRKMNNAENYAAVEVKRKSAKEEERYEMAERGEHTSKKQRNFEKPDKPDDEKEHVRDNLSSLSPEDLRNVAILMLLCMSSKFGTDGVCRFITRDSCRIGVWECTVFVKGKIIIWTSWGV